MFVDKRGLRRNVFILRCIFGTSPHSSIFKTWKMKALYVTPPAFSFLTSEEKFCSNVCKKSRSRACVYYREFARGASFLGPVRGRRREKEGESKRESDKCAWLHSWPELKVSIGSWLSSGLNFGLINETLLSACLLKDNDSRSAVSLIARRFQRWPEPESSRIR